MTRPARSVLAISVALLLIGCSTPADRSPSPAVTATTSSTAIPTPSAAAATTPAMSPDHSSSPTPTDFTAPWTGITWQKLAADDLLAEIRAVTQWRGGYIARGDPANADGSEPENGNAAVHTRLWISPDGRTWEPLGADVLGASAIVVGMAPTADGIAALTVQPGQTVRDDETNDLSWSVAGPVQTWTSSDGRTWTAHPGPAVDVSAYRFITVHDIDWLQASTAPLLIVARGPRPHFVSTDAVEWERQATTGLPAASTIQGAGSGFVGRLDDAIATSRDGRTWTTKALPDTCSADQGIVVGRNGMIVTGLRDGGGHAAQWTWCSSADGRTWDDIPGLAPLGRMQGEGSQECLDSCPDGSLVGDGNRFVAYRGWADQVGWTSFDGRTWQPLTFDGLPEQTADWIDHRCTQTLVLMPMGLRCTTDDGASWFGEPHS